MATFSSRANLVYYMVCIHITMVCMYMVCRPTFCFFLFLSVSFCYFLLLSVSFCFFLLLSVSFCFLLLLSVTFCYFLLLFSTLKSTLKFEVFHPTSEVAEVKGGPKKLKCPNFKSDTTFTKKKVFLIHKNVIEMFVRCTVCDLWFNSLCCFCVDW
jgi:hypothetical protein